MSKLKQDLLWNYASLAILAASGLVINFLVAHFFGHEALGIFNQVFAVYIIGSQFAICGVHYSVLRSTAQEQLSAEKRSSTIGSGLLLALIFGLIAWAALDAAGFVIASLLESPRVQDGIVYVAPALLLFALNKTVLAALNGLRCMKAFAFCQGLRYVLIVAVLIWGAFASWPAELLPISFLIAEAVLACVSFALLYPHIDFSARLFTLQEMWRHLRFGLKGFLSGVFVDANTRVDVLMVGYFLADSDVGRYSLAAILAEGLYQVLVVAKNNFNPMIAQMLKDNDWDGIHELVRKSWKYIYPGMLILLVCGGVAFYGYLHFFSQDEFLYQTLAIYLILGSGILIASGFIPFDAILLQGGKPGWHTVLTFCMLGTNVVGNAVLIPVFGLHGAALGTATSVVATAIYLNVITRKQLGASLLR